MKPTDEERQWLWEQCGFTEVKYNGAFFKGWQGYLNGELVHIPNLTDISALGFLFKYAVPKLREHYKEVTDSFLPERYYHSVVPLLEDWVWGVEDNPEEDPALALFSAIYKALGGN